MSTARVFSASSRRRVLNATVTIDSRDVTDLKSFVTAGAQIVSILKLESRLASRSTTTLRQFSPSFLALLSSFGVHVTVEVLACGAKRRQTASIMPGRTRHATAILGPELASRLPEVRVLLVGAGGIGCELCMYPRSCATEPSAATGCGQQPPRR